jgi:hypothetical protein
VRAFSEKFSNVKFRCPDDCDIMFPGLRPSLAIILVVSSDILQTTRSLTTLQQKFKNAFAIVVNYSDTEWEDLQTQLPPGNIRLLRSPSDAFYIVDLVVECFSMLHDTDKLNLQSSYFTRLEEELTSATAATSIMHQHFAVLNIPDEEGQILIEGASSIANIILASEDFLREYCPMDEQYISLLCNSFQNVNGKPGEP